MKNVIIPASFLVGSIMFFHHPANRDIKPCACDDAKIREITSPATQDASIVYIDCNLSLAEGSRITKRLILEGDKASNLTLDLNKATIDGGAGTINEKKDMIEVRSRTYVKNGVRVWARPRNINIRDAHIIGSVRIWGMAKNGQGVGSEFNDGQGTVNYFKQSSRTTRHKETARENAPTRISLEKLTITGVGRNPLYFAPGVTFCTLLSSTLDGESDAVAVYLDAESRGMLLKNNTFKTKTANKIFERWDRPLIAIDGSSENRIINNTFSSLSHGGIYLYRNCGEGGVIRHNTPSRNHIINNIFIYNVYEGDNPAVFVASKNADFTTTGGPFGFCSDDAGYNFGSSRSNYDHASSNVVVQNQIYKRRHQEMIRVKNTDQNEHNYTADNITVESAIERFAGCYLQRGAYKQFLRHGQSKSFNGRIGNRPVVRRFTCNDGELEQKVE